MGRGELVKQSWQSTFYGPYSQSLSCQFSSVFLVVSLGNGGRGSASTQSLWEEEGTGVSLQASTSVFYPCVGVIVPPLSLSPWAGQSPVWRPAQKALCQGESDRSSGTFM